MRKLTAEVVHRAAEFADARARVDDRDRQDRKFRTRDILLGERLRVAEA